jgi:phosphoglycolate phosphatase-like HAD superfamily hydrolase
MSDSEIWAFVKKELDKLYDALINDEPEKAGEISSGICSQFETIRDDIRLDKKSKISREIEKRPHDDEEYNTSEPDQSKWHEDGEEILERVEEESDEAFNERFPFPGFPDALDELETLQPFPKEEAIKIVTAIKAKYFS